LQFPHAGEAQMQGIRSRLACYSLVRISLLANACEIRPTVALRWNQAELGSIKRKPPVFSVFS
jgi:hypothetical protein